MQISIVEETFDPLAWLDDYQHAQISLKPGSYGASVFFVGTMRDFNQGDTVEQMYLEYYPEMTQFQLQKIAEETMALYELNDLLVVHRVGLITPGDSIVLVAAWSAHRDDAFVACRNVIDTLKTRATFWKKEQLDNTTSRWVTPQS